MLIPTVAKIFENFFLLTSWLLGQIRSNWTTLYVFKSYLRFVHFVVHRLSLFYWLCGAQFSRVLLGKKKAQCELPNLKRIQFSIAVQLEEYYRNHCSTWFVRESDGFQSVTWKETDKRTVENSDVNEKRTGSSFKQMTLEITYAHTHMYPFWTVVSITTHNPLVISPILPTHPIIFLQTLNKPYQSKP